MSRTVAIVEDEPALRENYAQALRRYGHQVNTYPDRPSAHTAFSLKLPDLVIIDIGLADEPEGASSSAATCGRARPRCRSCS